MARKTAVYPNIGRNISYPALGLCGEAGEVADKIKKIFRDKNGKVGVKTRRELVKEMGDVLWYLSTLSSELKVDLNDVAKKNLEKLNTRKKQNKLKGSGDNR